MTKITARDSSVLVGGGKGNSHFQFYDKDIMPINLWAPTHLPPQRHPKNLTINSTGKMDVNSIATYYFGPSGILALHLNHTYRV